LYDNLNKVNGTLIITSGAFTH